jgi:hypothetical protein
LKKEIENVKIENSKNLNDKNLMDIYNDISVKEKYLIRKESPKKFLMKKNT